MTTVSAPTPTTLPPAPARIRWAAWLSVALLLVGLAAGFFAGRATAPETELPADLADSTVTMMLDDYLAASNSGDATRIAEFFAPDATFTDTTKDGSGYVMEGNTRIAEAIASWDELGFEGSEPGTAIQNGEFVARYSISSVGEAMAVYQVRDGKIQNLWIVRP